MSVWVNPGLAPVLAALTCCGMDAGTSTVGVGVVSTSGGVVGAGPCGPACAWA
ncbi:MAG: hypothetical protein JO148_07745, partial [Acidimicrobiia bacterium]|nr:hypothetical protein [Acidimicrobiia bacterium]